MSDRVVRIGGGSAFFVDSALATPQLLAAGVDYIIYDYLAEGSMGLFGRMRAADPESGFPGDFLDVHVGPFLAEIARTGTRIVANAGAVNPAGLVRAVRSAIDKAGLKLKVAAIAGDDLLDRAAALAAAGTRDMFTGAPFPAKGVTSVNAYLGAFPIAEALARGADIVITGRVADSALALGPLVHEFGWAPRDYDRLAAGTVVGHLIECGAQVTGGTFTDWREVAGWADIGAPVAECRADGAAVITKPEGTGGLVSIGTVAEQLLYEVGDPQAYFVADVACDFTTVRLEADGPDRVRVSGASGRPPTATYKACATFDDGWRAVVYQPVIGPAAADKARRQAEALFERGARMLAARNLAPFRRTEAVLIGAGEAAGARCAVADPREIVLKLAVEHDEAIGAQMFAREQLAAISAMAPGTSVGFGTQVQPVMGLVSFLVDKQALTATVDFGDGPKPAAAKPQAGFDPATIARPAPPAAPARTGAPARLETLAFTRSGEKGETINVAVIAREARFLPYLRAALTVEALADWFAHLLDARARITIYDVPGIGAFNIVMDGALPGGLNASQRLDSAAKSVGQQLLDFPVPAGR